MIYNNYVNHKSQILGVDIKYNYIDFLDLLCSNFAGDLQSNASSKSIKYFYFYWYSHLSLELSNMTDEERDQIDTDAETYMRTCSVAIQTLKNEGIDTAQCNRGKNQTESM